MAVKAEWVINKMEEWANPSLAEEWDNIGLLIGDEKQEVNKILVALDATQAVVNKAIQGNYNLILTHHPLIFDPLRRITASDTTGCKIMRLIKNDICLYAAHTNLDAAVGGVNDILYKRLQLTNKEPLLESGLGFTANLLRPLPLREWAEFVKSILYLQEIRVAGPPGKIIHKIGVCAGDASGMRYCQAAIQKGCDLYITGDLRYHGMLEALEKGLCLMDITHYASEAPVLSAIVSRLLDEAKKENKTLSIHPFFEENIFMTINS